MIFLKKYWHLTLFIIVVLSISGYFFYQSQQDLDFNITGVDVKTPETPTAKAPVGDTSQGGHWHGDEWHAEPHPTNGQIDTPTAQRTDGVSSETDTKENTGKRSGTSDTTSPNLTVQTPPDDYYGDPLYWIPSIEYETNRTTTGDLSSDPVIPKEKRDRIDDIHNLRWREGSRHLTQADHDRIAVEILAEVLQPLDVAKFIIVTGYWDEKYAREYAQQAIEEDPNNFDAHVILTQLQPLSADKIAGYRRLLDWNPSSFRVLLGLGVWVKDYREAISYFKKVTQLSPNYLNGSAFGKLGMRYQRIGDYDKALAALKKAYAINPFYSYREQIEAIERGTPLYIKGDR